MPRHAIRILDTGETYACDTQRNLLSGMEALGRRGIPVGCRNGGCGICKVQVMSGDYAKGLMSRAHVSEDDERAGRVLACRVQPCSDLELQVIGAMRKSVCRTA
ncbi:MAG: hypothetical protein RLY78_3034 [Pseudomonadota bacterium]|jgi:ferredoxin|uniref:2Fe-2S iron-sulfur cluster-binding protein n=1 Tax=Pseudaquabacterium rugosum TaxID=2984194 RepID=A0ABU9BEW5_9BURK